MDERGKEEDRLMRVWCGEVYAASNCLQVAIVRSSGQKEGKKCFPGKSGFKTVLFAWRPELLAGTEWGRQALPSRDITLQHVGSEL